jgi:hypothetical protein
MKPEAAKQELEKRIVEQTGKTFTELTPAQGIRVMLDFYKYVRADDCNAIELSDMLLFQWGVYNQNTQGPWFEIDITRQFAVYYNEDDHEIFQLSLTFYFSLSEQLSAIGEGNRWCSQPERLPDFEETMISKEAYQAVQGSHPSMVKLEYRRV